MGKMKVDKQTTTGKKKKQHGKKHTCPLGFSYLQPNFYFNCINENKEVYTATILVHFKSNSLFQMITSNIQHMCCA